MRMLSGDGSFLAKRRTVIIYFTQMISRGPSHLGAVCVVAAEFAERAFVVLCDIDGRAVNPGEAKAIIAEQLTVSPETRARRRSAKAGKAAQRSARGTTRQPSQTPTRAAVVALVKKTA